MSLPFSDRNEAAQELADALKQYQDHDDVLVLALPRGGVPIGKVIADRLDTELDLMLVRKVGHPQHRELAMGAIASGGIRVRNPQVADIVSDEAFEQVEKDEREELRRREQAYRGDREDPEIEGRTVILVDDGLATGATMEAAAQGVRDKNPEQLIVAVPVGAPDSVERVRQSCDELVCVETPQPFQAIGKWYRDFSQVSDDEVRQMLNEVWDRDSSQS